MGWHNGKRRRKYVTRKTRAEANKALRALTAQAESGTLSTNRLPTVAQWMEIYFREVASAKVRSSTLHRYREEVEHHISPLLGRIRIDKLAPGHLTAFYHDRLTVLAPGSVRRLHANLRRALNVAVRWQLIHANPVLMVDPPSIPHSEVRPYSLSEAREFLQSIRGHRLEARWVVGIALGLRQGEVLGLYWEDVDFEHGLIRCLSAQTFAESASTTCDIQPPVCCSPRASPFAS